MIRSLLPCLVAAFILTPAAAQTRKGEPAVVSSDMTDPSMVAAVRDARASLDQFWDAFVSGSILTSGFSIKVGLPTNDDSLEHIWVVDVRRNGRAITGVLGNEPVNLRDHARAGERVTFTTADVTDWGYLDRGKLRGHFTTRLLLDGMDPSEAGQIAMMLHEEPLP